jgi:periplasmic copper chaperone A
MPRRTTAATAATAVVAAAAIALVAVPTAGAHVSLHPNAIPAGSFVTTQIRVPNEEDGAATTGVRVKLPSGVLSALGATPPGWRFAAKTRKLAKPIKTDDGTMTTEVTEVSWTGGRIPPGQFADFPLTLSVPAAAKQGDVLTFKTLQAYSDGMVARWIGGPSDDRPAPTVDVTAPGGPVLDVTGGDAGPPPELPAGAAGGGSSPAVPGPPATRTVVEQQGKGLAIAALIVGALGLLAGGAALVTRRRATS